MTACIHNNPLMCIIITFFTYEALASHKSKLQMQQYPKIKKKHAESFFFSFKH